MVLSRRAAALAIAVVFMATATTAQGAIVTVGSPLTQAFAPTEFNAVATIANNALPEPGAHVTSPVSGTVIRWRLSGAVGGPFALQVLRPAGGTAYTGVTTSAPAIPTSMGIETFPTNLPVQAGDLIALRNSNTGDKVGVFQPLKGASFLAWLPPLSDGETVAANEERKEVEIGFDAEVQPPPTIASLAPATGSFLGGTAVTVAGTDFTGATAVRFGATPATSFAVNSETQITAVAPAAAGPGPVDVSVTTLAGTTAVTPAGQFRFEACTVPKLKGKKLKRAKKLLKASDCKLGKVKRRKGARAKAAKVVKQGPKRGKTLAPGSKVNVTLG
jgi:IPT/TIG domain/PASTA domain